MTLLFFSLLLDFNWSCLSLCGLLIIIVFTFPFSSQFMLGGSVLQGGMMEWMLILMSLMVFTFSVVMIRSDIMILSGSTYMVLFNLQMLLSIMLFLIKHILGFYIVFEMSVIPIFLIVMGWGYQSERISAGLSLMLYTVGASLPLMMGMLLLMNWYPDLSIKYLNMNLFVHNKSFVLGVVMLMAFLVKLPLYGVHMWLPKAHVEAPVAGSMVLAAVLLKLGGWGFMLMLPMVYSVSLLSVFTSVGVMGMLFGGILCLRLLDIKMIIAYSSVCHMSLCVVAFMSGGAQGSLGGAIMLIIHGFTSSFMFMLSFVYYKWSHSRSMIFTKGTLSGSIILCCLWFLGIACNLGVPPSPNFLSEALILMSVINEIPLIAVVFFISLLPLAGMSFTLYSRVTQGQGSIFAFSVSETLTNNLVLLFHLLFIFSWVASYTLLEFSEPLFHLISN